MKMENISISRSEYFELLRYKEIVQIFEELMHEPKFKEDFINRVLEAEERVAKGEKMRFNSVKDMSTYLDKMEE